MGVMREVIIDYIENYGPATAAEIAEANGLTTRQVATQVQYMHTIQKPKALYVAGYKRQVGRSGKEARIYGVGNYRDAKRPDFSNCKKETNQRSRDKNRAIIRARSRKTQNPFVDFVLNLIRGN